MYAGSEGIKVLSENKAPISSAEEELGANRSNKRVGLPSRGPGHGTVKKEEIWDY